MNSRAKKTDSVAPKNVRPFHRRPVLLYVTVTAMLGWIGFMVAMIWF
ncbi:hypothetical protein ACFL2H_01880 [Planctomycetota bacterium]